jgi:hypothetical protein
MGKASDKKVVKQAHKTLVDSIGNLLESHRERKFTSPQGSPQSRTQFCQAHPNLQESTVRHIETGRFLSLDVAKLRTYIAVTHGKSNPKFATSLKKVYEGLKEMDKLLKEL